jgi:hypothetical protein
LHVKQVFFYKDPKERAGLKVVLRKDPFGRHVTNKVQINLVELDMFRMETADEYLSLLAPISIDESIQLANIVAGLIFLL